MNDLPTSATPQPPVPHQPSAGGGLHKEVEAMPKAPETATAPEMGHDQELSPEVAAAGVRIHPTSIPVPPSVAQMGVAAVGAGVAMPPPAVKMPLTDDQIAQGLKQGLSSSWRWLAEWCIRKLKQVHRKLRMVGGHAVEVQE